MVWNTANGDAVGNVTTGAAEVDAVAISPDDATLATDDIFDGDSANRLDQWDITSGADIRGLKTGSAIASSLAFSPNGKTLAVGSDSGAVELWDPATGSASSLGTGLDYVTAVEFSPYGPTLAASSHDGDKSVAQLWNMATGKTTTLDLGSGTFNSMAYSANGKFLAIGKGSQGLNGGIAEVWNTATGKQVGRALNTGSDSVNAVTLSPDGSLLITGDDSGTELWDTAKGKLMKTLDTGADPVYSVALSPNGKITATGDGSGQVELWDVDTGQQFATLDALSGKDAGEVAAVTFSLDGKSLTADYGNGVITWDTSGLTDPLGRLCTAAGGSLTRGDWKQYVPTGPSYSNPCPASSSRP